jgi:hypothetical protein
VSERETQNAPFACREMEQKLLLYVCDELNAEERASVEAHVMGVPGQAGCAKCAASLEREKSLQQAIASLEAPADSLDRSEVLLAQSRSELAEALDDAKVRGTQGFSRVWREFAERLRNFGRLWALHPAPSAVLLLLLGFGLGVGAPMVYQAIDLRAPLKPAMVVDAAPRLTDQELQNLGVVGLKWEPAQGTSDATDAAGAPGALEASQPRVELQLFSQRPMRIEGAADDTEVQRVLTYMVANSQRFDPGVLLDSLDLLRPSVGDPNVRRALCAAAREDENPGVRLKALESLRGYGQDSLVRQTLLASLRKDANCGVRVEALNSLVASLGAEEDSSTETLDTQIVSALRKSRDSDPNQYVRMVSSAALRQIAPEPSH